MAATIAPEMASAFLTTAMMNMDGEGMDDLQAWLRKGALQSGLVKATPEEQQEMEQAAQQAKPDPQAAVLESQARALEAGAAKDGKLAEKSCRRYQAVERPARSKPRQDACCAVERRG
jgi:hypothetical protein